MRFAASLLDEVPQVGTHLDQALRARLHLLHRRLPAREDGEYAASPRPELRPIRCGNAKHPADDVDRQQSRELRHQVVGVAIHLIEELIH